MADSTGEKIRACNQKASCIVNKSLPSGWRVLTIIIDKPTRTFVASGQIKIQYVVDRDEGNVDAFIEELSQIFRVQKLAVAVPGSHAHRAHDGGSATADTTRAEHNPTDPPKATS